MKYGEKPERNDRAKNDVTLTVTAMAQDTIVDMLAQVDNLKYHYGRHDERVIEATDTLLHNLVPLFGGFFGTHNIITRDGDLSLFVQNGHHVPVDSDEGREGRTELKTGFVYGLIYHTTRRRCKTCGTMEWTNPEYRSQEWKDKAPKACGSEGSEWASHEWDYHDGEPIPGTWSFHS